MNNFYALLVGIDNYPDPAIRLYGCVNDVNAVEEYLRQRFIPGADPSRIRVLRDGEAKRQDLIATFQEHLGRAEAGDTALFFYAGHGSQEQAPQEFWAMEPDHKNETLVCWDSRTEGSWDLADKELAKLIAALSSKGVHVAVILDCCHSGSGTREIFQDAAERRIPLDARLRPFGSYLPAVQETAAQQVPGGTERGMQHAPSGWETTATSRHVLLAACRDDQTAKEYAPQGTRHGALTYFLLDTLTSANGVLTYLEVFQRVSTLVSANVVAQNPQLEASVSADASAIFLSGEPTTRGEFFTASWRAGAWSINGGALHGIPARHDGETVNLALFLLGATAADLNALTKAVATATISDVTATNSRIVIADESNLDRQSVYKAVVTALPLPPIPVLLEGDAAGQEMIRHALAKSLYAVEAAANAKFRVLSTGGQFIVARAGDDRPLMAQLPMKDEYAAAVVNSLDHIAKWTSLANLKNPLTRIPEGQVKLSLIKDKVTGEELTGADSGLEYTRDDEGQLQNPFFWIRVQNGTDRPMYCALLVLTEMFGITTELLPNGTQRLNPGEELWALGGNKVYAGIPKPLQDIGVTQSRDVIKLLASTGPFDARLLEQPEQEGPIRPTRGILPVSLTGTLNRLMSRVQTRSLTAQPDTPNQNLDDFVAYTVGITTIRPRDARVITAATPADLGNGVVIDPHPALNAQARLTTLPQIERDLGTLAMPAMFRADVEPDSPQPLRFSSARGSDPGLSVLELTPAGPDGINFAAVTPSNPLRITIDIPFDDGSEVLPYAFDGQFFLPLGYAVSSGGKTVAELSRLPHPVELLQRSLTGSIRILFQKLVVTSLGVPYEYPILAVATKGPSGRVVYNSDAAAVKSSVAAATRILVCVHGIIGDTRAMAAALLAADTTDLVLTFDYENINTTIEENAHLLKDRLAASGLDAAHGKCVQIVAHSMGGPCRALVYRKPGRRLGGTVACCAGHSP